MCRRIGWIDHISRIVLKEVNISVEDYINTITTPGFPLDFIGIIVLCRIYHFHLAVYTSTGVWATCRAKSIKDCIFGVVYNGHFKFTETVKKGMEQNYQRWIDQQQQLGRMPSHDLNEKPSESEVETKFTTVQQALQLVNNLVMCQHGDKVSMCKPCLFKRVKRETPAQNQLPFKTETEMTKEYGDQSETLASVLGQPLAESSRDDVLSSETAEQIPVSASVTETVTSDIICMESIGLKTVSHDLILSCPMCPFTDKTQKACVVHIQENHPDYKFKCKYCVKEFPHHTSLYRHEKEHQAPSRICIECGYSCVYKSEMERHVAVHQEILPFGCDKCDKRFASEKSSKRHAQVHADLTFTCTVCGMVKSTQDRLYTHFRGAHGKGYTAKCGCLFQWPGTRACHQESCDRCKELIQIAQKCKLVTDTPEDDVPPVKKEKVEIKEERKQNIKKEQNVGEQSFQSEHNIKIEQNVKQEDRPNKKTYKFVNIYKPDHDGW